jgi:hypothetical protein
MSSSPASATGAPKFLFLTLFDPFSECSPE